MARLKCGIKPAESNVYERPKKSGKQARESQDECWASVVMMNVILAARKSMVNPGKNRQLLLRTGIVVGLDEFLLGSKEELFGGGAALEPLKREEKQRNQIIEFVLLQQDSGDVASASSLKDSDG